MSADGNYDVDLGLSDDEGGRNDKAADGTAGAAVNGDERPAVDAASGNAT